MSARARRSGGRGGPISARPSAAPALPRAAFEVVPAVPRPPLVRPRQGRLLGGVAVGLAHHLGWPVRTVRIILVALTFVSGTGVILYAWLWALLPSSDVLPPSEQTRPVPPPPGSGQPSGSGHLGDLALGALLLAAAGSLIAARYSLAPSPGVVLPILVVIGGAVLAYSQLDEVERRGWASRAGVTTRGAVLRVVGGLVIVLVGLLLVVVQRTDLALVGRVLVATAAVLGGIALVLAPWAVRVWRDLEAERTARIRESERAEIAARLHDSVLQTLALIQRSAADSAQVARLARAQERDLRDWLYGPRPAEDATVATAVREAAAEVEDRHGVAVDVVLVGDRRLDDRGAALVAALREAMLNAVRHAGAPVSVYVEVGRDGVEAFVRDRGPGFDVSGVPPDRLGVRESIVGRMERHGGSAQVRTGPDGTEVRLTLPIKGERADQAGDHDRDHDREGSR